MTFPTKLNKELVEDTGIEELDAKVSARVERNDKELWIEMPWVY